ncbi:MAG: glycosyltransferase [Nitrospirae bacterium]|nr:glycosyltransferase [Nitrospirota bacterium]
MEKHKIFHIIKNYKGNNPLLNSMILGLDDRFDARACYLFGSPDGKNLLDSHGKAIYLDMNAKESRLAIIQHLVRLLKSEQPQILHCHKHKTTALGTVAAIFSRTPYVVSHVHGMNRTRTLLTRLINWLLLRHTSLIVGVSERVRTDILSTNWGLAREKVVTLWNGIDIAPANALSLNRKLARKKMDVSESEFVFGSVGRLARTKGHEYLLASFSKIRENCPDARVVIIGDGPLRRDLEDQARELGISQNVLFTGFRSDVLELLPGFDIFVLPSIAEGLSLALLEAMASKLPVIASDVGGIPEVFGNEEIGRLIPSGDIAALGSALLEIYSLDKKDKMLLGENARKRIEDEFNIDFMCRKLVGIYESLLMSGKG